MKHLFLLAALLVEVLLLGCCWVVGYGIVMGLWLRFGPQELFANVEPWLSISMVAMTFLVFAAGYRAMAATFRMLADYD